MISWGGHYLRSTEGILLRNISLRPFFMANDELRKLWAISLRHLAASRFYLQEHLPNTDAEKFWINAQEFLHHNELELALEQLQELGELCCAPRTFWSELLLSC
jgi:hypothetical protein